MSLLPAKQIRSSTFTEAQVDRVFAAAAIQASVLKLGAGAGLVNNGSGGLVVDTATATVTFTAGTWTFPTSVLQVTGTPTTANDAVNKNYVDNFATGMTWKRPVTVLGMIGERTVAQIDALTPVLGDSVIAADDGTPSAGTSDLLAEGDIAEFDGTSWKLIVDNASDAVPAGIRVVLSTTQTLQAPFADATDDGRVVVSVVGGTPDFTGSFSEWDDTGDAVDGNSLIIQGPESNNAESARENIGYVFDGVVPTGDWIQFTGAGQIVAGAGLDKTGNTLFIGDINRGVQVNAVSLEIDASEASHTTGGIEASANSWQFRIKTHAGALGAAVTTNTDGVNIDGDIIDITFTPTNYDPDIAPPEASDVDDLAAHLAGIDNRLADVGASYQESIATQNITGTDTALTAELSEVPLSNANLKLHLNGILQRQGATFDYTVSGKVITWLANTGTAVDMDTADVLIASYESAA